MFIEIGNKKSINEWINVIINEIAIQNNDKLETIII